MSNMRLNTSITNPGALAPAEEGSGGLFGAIFGGLSSGSETSETTPSPQVSPQKGFFESLFAGSEERTPPQPPPGVNPEALTGNLTRQLKENPAQEGLIKISGPTLTPPTPPPGVKTPTLSALGHLLGRGEALFKKAPPLSFLAGSLKQLTPLMATDILTNNDFIQKALGQDIPQFMKEPMPLKDLIGMLEVAAPREEKALEKQFDLSESVTPLQFFKTLGVDPQKVVVSLLKIQEELPEKGVGAYVEALFVETKTQDPEDKATRNVPKKSRALSNSEPEETPDAPPQKVEKAQKKKPKGAPSPDELAFEAPKLNEPPKPEGFKKAPQALSPTEEKTPLAQPSGEKISARSSLKELTPKQAPEKTLLGKAASLGPTEDRLRVELGEFEEPKTTKALTSFPLEKPSPMLTRVEGATLLQEALRQEPQPLPREISLDESFSLSSDISSQFRELALPLKHTENKDSERKKDEEEESPLFFGKSLDKNEVSKSPLPTGELFPETKPAPQAPRAPSQGTPPTSLDQITRSNGGAITLNVKDKQLGGDLKVGLNVVDRDVSLNIQAQNEDLKERLTSSISDLNDSLRSQDLNLLSANVTLSQERENPRDQRQDRPQQSSEGIFANLQNQSGNFAQQNSSQQNTFAEQTLLSGESLGFIKSPLPSSVNEKPEITEGLKPAHQIQIRI